MDSGVAGPTSVLDRTMALLDIVASSDGPITIGDLARRTGMPKSTVSRLVAALVEQRYLRRTDSGVTLGIRLFEFGARAAVPKRLRSAAAPVMRRIWDLTGERVVLWVRQDSDMVLLAAMAGRLPMLPTRAGMRTPALTTASGKACLAFSAPAVVAGLSAPLVDDVAVRLRHELDEVRASTIALDAGIAYPGIHAVATPVLGADRRVLGAISVAGPAGGLDTGRIAPLVREAAASLTRRLEAA